MRDQITFLLGSDVQRVGDVAPTTTLLQWLRRSKRMVGTKEGCAEGDCGACSIVLGELKDGQVRYRAVNACILLMGQLEGRLVLTVEHVAGLDGVLHPCQQALIDLHGSQCGFCTPGFVMSLYAAYLTEQRPSRARLNDLLAGNLCRCTGYGGILAAGERMYDLARPDWDVERRARDAAALDAIQHCETVALDCEGERAFSPSDVDAFAGLVASHPDATVVAGATDVGLWVTKQYRVLGCLIHIDRVRDLQSVAVEGRTLRIGAAARYCDVEAVLGAHFPDFGELVRRIGGQQVRNSGTIGGNIANGSPIGDMPPALIALGATLHLRRADVRRSIPLEAFFLSYGKQDRLAGEFVESIEVGLLDDPLSLRCYKVSKRFDSDITAVLGALWIDIAGGYVRDARIAFGGMAAIPKRAKAVEAALCGHAWSEATVAAALAAFELEFAPISDFRASADYRLRVAKAMLQKYFIERADEATATRLVGRGAAFG
jgi:xanthine dehydrogenase small subunit